MDTKLAARSATPATIRRSTNMPNVQRAIELAKIGEPALAEEMLRHQAKIGLADRASRADPARQEARSSGGAAVACEQRPARGARPMRPIAIPTRAGRPLNGWRVDPALAFGHIVQESAFRRTAVSTAGAVGLMQVLPVTAQMVSRNRGVPYYTRRAHRSAATISNIGQSFIEMMRGSSGTAGQLPRVIASYNAGPLPVAAGQRSTTRAIRCCGSNPSLIGRRAITCPAVLRNMWVYQGLNSEDTPTLKAMAEHRWPTFPTSMTTLSH